VIPIVAALVDSIVPQMRRISMRSIGGLGTVDGLSGGSVFGDGESFVDWMARSFV
jgi:hypothetical protein